MVVGSFIIIPKGLMSCILHWDIQNIGLRLENNFLSGLIEKTTRLKRVNKLMRQKHTSKYNDQYKTKYKRITFAFLPQSTTNFSQLILLLSATSQRLYSEVSYIYG